MRLFGLSPRGVCCSAPQDEEEEEEIVDQKIAVVEECKNDHHVAEKWVSFLPAPLTCKHANCARLSESEVPNALRWWGHADTRRTVLCEDSNATDVLRQWQLGSDKAVEPRESRCEAPPR